MSTVFEMKLVYPNLSLFYMNIIDWKSEKKWSQIPQCVHYPYTIYQLCLYFFLTMAKAELLYPKNVGA